MEPSLVPLGTAEARVKYIVQNTVYNVHNSLLHTLPSTSYLSACMCAYYLSRLVLGDFLDTDFAARDLLRRGQD